MRWLEPRVPPAYSSRNVGNADIRTFIDTSAYVKLFVSEHGSESMLRLMRRVASEPVLMSSVSRVELQSVLVRLQNMQLLTSAAADRIYPVMERAWSKVEAVAITDDVLALARTLVRQHQLRTLDSLQLSCAMSARRDSGQAVLFVAADDRLLAAAEAEGFPVFNPAGS